MTTRIVRTTRKIETNDRQEPIEEIHEREVDRILREHEGESVEVNEMRIAPAAPGVRASVIEPPRPTESYHWLKAMLAMTEHQMRLLRDLEYRMHNIEHSAKSTSEELSVERAAWWGLWAVLMIILGTALVVVITLILSSLMH